jgi:hypothetical protein
LEGEGKYCSMFCGKNEIKEKSVSIKMITKEIDAERREGLMDGGLNFSLNLLKGKRLKKQKKML